MQAKQFKKLNKRMSSRVNNCIYMYNNFTLTCCEGGPLTAGCYHDRCTGAKRR